MEPVPLPRGRTSAAHKPPLADACREARRAVASVLSRAVSSHALDEADLRTLTDATLILESTAERVEQRGGRRRSPS
jgi:hypothetical protein